jgi:hypothetical protein
MFKPILASAAIAVVGGSVQAATLNFESTLNSAQTVNVSDSDATGSAKLSVDTSAQTLDLLLEVVGISLDNLADAFVDGANAALGPIHIHDGVAGAQGPVAVPFVFGSSYTETALGFMVNVNDLSYADATAISGFGESFDDFVAGLNNAEYYFNIHTDAVPGGEIRGQAISAVPLPASALFLLAGLGGLGLVKRKRA